MSYKLVHKPLTEAQRQEINRILEKYDNSDLNILNTLIEIQNILDEKYIGEEVCEIVSKATGKSVLDLYNLLTFYSMLDTEPRPLFKIEVCHCGSCYINDSESLIHLLERKLGIKMGEHTYDWLFGLETCPCVGACEIGPVIKIGEEVYGNLNDKVIDSILEDLYARKDELNELYAKRNKVV